MSSRVGFGLLWLGTIAYAVFLAPPDQPDTLALIQQLSLGEWQGINPLIVALFNLMGIWPLIYTSVLLFEGREQKVWAWPFAVGSFLVGAFALLPYLTLRRSQPEFTGKKSLLLKILDSRWWGIGLTVGAIALLLYGLTQGDWANFLRQWQTSRFIHVMSLDFVLLSLLFPALLRDDMARRGLSNSRLFWGFALVPLLGPLAYLCWRSPVTATNAAPSMV